MLGLGALRSRVQLCRRTSSNPSVTAHRKFNSKQQGSYSKKSGQWNSLFLLSSAAFAGAGLAFYFYSQIEEGKDSDELAFQRLKADEILFPTTVEIQGPMKGKEVPPRKGTLYDDVILTIDRKPENGAPSTKLYQPVEESEKTQQEQKQEEVSSSDRDPEPTPLSTLSESSNTPQNTATETESHAEQVQSLPSGSPIPPNAAEAFRTLLSLTLVEQRRQNEEQLAFIQKFLEELYQQDFEKRDKEWKAKENEAKELQSKLHQLQEQLKAAESGHPQAVQQFAQQLAEESALQINQFKERKEQEIKTQLQTLQQKLLDEFKPDPQQEQQLNQQLSRPNQHQTLKHLQQICADLMSLRKAMEERRGFSVEIQSLRAAFKERHADWAEKMLDLIPEHTTRYGVISLSEIKERFQEINHKAKKVSLVPNEGGLFWYLVSDVASKFLIDELFSNKTTKTLQRAELLVNTSQIGRSVSELEKLGDAPVALLFGDWKKEVNQRVLVEMVLDTILTDVKIQLLSPTEQTISPQ